MATSVRGVLTGRGATFIILDDILKPDEALSNASRRAAIEWYGHSLISRFDDKATGCLIVVAQRLHEDDLVGHLLAQGGWTLLRFPAIAEEDEVHTIHTPYGTRTYTRHKGEALHPEREPLEVLEEMRRVQGSYTFASQYQQRPAPLGGGMVKLEWFKPYTPYELPTQLETIIQSWDTANKTSDTNDYSVCTTWGISNKHPYLLDVLRTRLEYPALRRFVKSHARKFGAKIVLIEDKPSGTQLIQDLRSDAVYETTGYQTKLDKISRMSTASSLIENGQYDDQADSTSQMLDWAKQGLGSFWYEQLAREEFEKLSKNEINVEVGSESEKPSSVEQPSPVCGLCGNPNLSRWAIQGVSGAIEESCVCGWSRIIPRPPQIRTAPKQKIPSFL